MAVVEMSGGPVTGGRREREEEGQKEGGGEGMLVGHVPAY
jgi:hypothetical protein